MSDERLKELSASAVGQFIYRNTDGDEVKVVRCKDCKYCTKHSSFDRAYYTCDRAEDYMVGDTIGVSFEPDADFFCADGERKDEVSG